MESKNKELEKLYAETFHSIQEGMILKGKILALKQDGVIIDIGYKSEGIVPIHEFSDEEVAKLKPGNNIEVFVEELRDSDGTITLSKERAAKIKVWETLEAALRDGRTVEGKITGKTKGGFSVDICGVSAFLPGSQADIKPIKDAESLIGKKANFKVLRLNNKLSNVIVSRRVILEKELEQKKVETIGKLKEGNLIEGIVKNITDYGVFVDLGGIDGLLHISDISWGRINHPAEFFTIGDKIEVLVLKYDSENEKVTLGYKQKKPDPWTVVDEKYSIGKIIKGKVVSITDYGAFIEIEEGLEGLVHMSEMDWGSRPKHPSKYLSVGEKVEAIVLKVDKEERRLSLSIKQARPSPWELILQRYKVGQRVSGKVKTITEFGVFVGLPEGIDALIHISDLSWTKHIKHPSEILKKGQKVDAIVLSIEPEAERMALGLKQIMPDPWLSEIPEKFKLGNECEGKVLMITDFGIFVELEGGVEGLIYSSEIVKTSDKTEESLKPGDKVDVRIIKVDCQERKIGLSMKNLKRNRE